MSITLKPDGGTKNREIGNWRETFNGGDFIKWTYKDSPYRVIADLDEDRGHWRTLFTSIYGGSYLIKGNCGSGPMGMTKAVTAARSFMKDNMYGCPPPEEYE